MKSLHRTVLILLVLLQASISAQAEQTGQWQGLEAARLQQVVQTLAASNEPRNLAFAAILGQTLQDGHAVSPSTLDKWRKAALDKAAPDDVLVLSMLGTFDSNKSDDGQAIRQQALLNWQRIEPDNLAPLLYQPLSAEALLQQASSRNQLERHHYPALRWMYQSLLQQLPDEQNSIAAELKTVASSGAPPAFKTLWVYCTQERQAADIKPCEHIGQVLRKQSSSLILNRLGVTILHGLPISDDEQAVLHQEHAHIRRLLQAAMLLEPGDFLKVLQNNAFKGERQVFEALLSQSSQLGLTLNPQAYWDWYDVYEWRLPPRKQVRQLAQDLAATGDAKKLAFAALLARTLDDRLDDDGMTVATSILQDSEEKQSSEYAMPQETLDEWRKAALAKAVADNDVWALYMLSVFNFGTKSDSIKALREEAVLRWQQAEPDNLAALLYQDGLSAQEIFGQAETRKQWREYQYPILRWMYQTLLQQLPEREKSFPVMLIEIEAGISFPRVRPLMETCKKNPPQPHSPLWQQCKSTAQILHEHASDAVARSIGLSISRTLTDDEAEKDRLGNEWAYIRWILRQGEDNLNLPKIFNSYLQRLQDESINSELQDIERRLLLEGVSLQPQEQDIKAIMDEFK